MVSLNKNEKDLRTFSLADSTMAAVIDTRWEDCDLSCNRIRVES